MNKQKELTRIVGMYQSGDISQSEYKSKVRDIEQAHLDKTEKAKQRAYERELRRCQE